MWTELQADRNRANKINHPDTLLFNREEELYSKDREPSTQTIDD